MTGNSESFGRDAEKGPRPYSSTRRLREILAQPASGDTEDNTAGTAETRPIPDNVVKFKPK